MQTIYLIELGVAVFLLLLLIGLMIFKKTRKWPVAVGLSLAVVGVLSYTGVTYYQEEPVFTLKGEKQIVLEANSPYEEVGFDASFHEKDVSPEVEVIGEVDTSKPGDYQVKYRYTYHKDQVVELERNIHVEDTVAPELTLEGDEVITIYVDQTYKEPGYKAEDNVDQDLTEQVTVEKNEIDSKKYELVYTVTDSSGNETKKTRTVNLKERPKVVKPVTVETVEDGGTTTAPGTGVIYLTFDDGPSTDITPKILDILKEEGVKATFFIINYNAQKEALVKREANEGHTVGIHGYSHTYKEIYQSVDTYMENLTKLQAKIKDSTGITTTITRFPGGSSNTVSRFNPGIMTTLTQVVVERGFRYYDWNVGSGDAGGSNNKEQVYRSVTSGLKKGRNNVVLMHDFSGNTKTLNALRDIIRYGKENGYTFSAITTSTPMVKHGVNN